MTREELNERKRLLELQADHTRWFSQEEFDRLRELSNKMFAEHPLPPAEGAEEIAYKYELKDEDDVGTDCVFIDDTIKAMQEFATLHAQRLAEKMKDANQFILDIARVLGIETDGVGFDELTLSIDDFKEAAEKMVEEKAVGFADWLSKLQPSQKVSVWSKNGEHRGLFTMDNEQLYKKYLKSIEP